MTIAMVFVAVMLLIGVVLRVRIGLFRWLYIPSSVIAGMVGLLVIQFHLAAIGQHQSPGLALVDAGPDVEFQAGR